VIRCGVRADKYAHELTFCKLQITDLQRVKEFRMTDAQLTAILSESAIANFLASHNHDAVAIAKVRALAASVKARQRSLV